MCEDRYTYHLVLIHPSSVLQQDLEVSGASKLDFSGVAEQSKCHCGSQNCKDSVSSRVSVNVAPKIAQIE